MITVCVPVGASDQIGAFSPDVRVLEWDGTGPRPDGIEDVELLVARYDLGGWSAEQLATLPRLVAIQTLTAGVDGWHGRVPEGVLLCNGRGIHTVSTAELALAGTLAVLRELPHFIRAQAERRWDRHNTDSIGGRRVVVVGAGDIGRTYAAAVEALSATTTLVARTARAGVHGVDELPGLLGRADVVLISLPYTSDTRHLVDAGFLAAMPDGAVLVNIARGPIVDTEALLAELSAGRLRAYLDVTDPEPLPAEHPLWALPNVVITPHVGGGTIGWHREGYHLAHEQIERYRTGVPLINVVERTY